MKKYSISNIIAYIQGNSRYKLFYSKWYFLIPGYIRRQIDTRINSMNKQCYNQGSCIECGCTTTQLQMANKACEGKCYPKMLNRKDWKEMEQGKLKLIDNEFWYIEFSKFKRV